MGQEFVFDANDINALLTITMLHGTNVNKLSSDIFHDEDEKGIQCLLHMRDIYCNYAFFVVLTNIYFL